MKKQLALLMVLLLAFTTGCSMFPGKQADNTERPTDAPESSSSPMMQTPTAVMTCETPERMRERAQRKGYKNGTKYGSLESQVNYDPRFRGMLPTPTAHCYNDGTAKPREDGVDRNSELNHLIAASFPKIGGKTFRLSPLFTQEMMGFPFGWTEYPFLSQDGEPKPSKHTETPSSPKLCTAYSKP